MYKTSCIVIILLINSIIGLAQDNAIDSISSLLQNSGNEQICDTMSLEEFVENQSAKYHSENDMIEYYKQKTMTPEQRAEYEKLQKRFERPKKTEPDIGFKLIYWAELALFIYFAVICPLRRLIKICKYEHAHGKKIQTGVLIAALFTIIVVWPGAFLLILWISRKLFHYSSLLGILFFIVCFALMWLINNLRNKHQNRITYEEKSLRDAMRSNSNHTRKL